MKISNTPKSSYYAVIFTSIRNVEYLDYDKVSDRMLELVQKQPGFLGFESAKEELGITVSYWQDEQSILNWRNNLEHQEAQRLGKEKFYKSYAIRICKVERAYFFESK
ncbi:MAG: antibiotic biosynthesis monooxygenase [Flavobacteriales bacterium]|nr:antibiotic biosynthesis monooxygenase [Flavobacteriales bacterium]